MSSRGITKNNQRPTVNLIKLMIYREAYDKEMNIVEMNIKLLKKWHKILIDISKLPKEVFDKKSIQNYIKSFKLLIDECKNRNICPVEKDIIELKKHIILLNCIIRTDKLFSNINDFKNIKSNNDMCSICIDRRVGKVLKFKCGHEFHMTCIIKWLSTKDKCPLCREILIEK